MRTLCFCPYDNANAFVFGFGNCNNFINLFKLDLLYLLSKIIFCFI